MRRRVTGSSFGVLSVGVLTVAACVSLSSPKTGGRGTIPVVHVPYKPGSLQSVRIALETAAKTGTVSGTGQWGIVRGDAQGKAFDTAQELPLDSLTAAERQGVVAEARAGSLLIWNGKKYRGILRISQTDSGFLVVNELPMDAYLRGVVPLEIGNRTAAEMAAVEAQAVAARTYAYKHLTSARAFDMYATVQDQVYGGVDAEKPQADTAIINTADVVVLYNGQPITTPYHSTCGGSTAAVSEVWYDQPDEPYLRPVSDRIPGSDRFYCDASPRFSWTQSFDADGLRAVMEKYLANYTNAPKSGIGRITEISEQGRTPSGRLRALTVQTTSGSYTLRGNDIRFVLRDPKGTILNSTFINVHESKANGEVSGLTINGRGYGHGIGMCQWGAIGRARAGQNFRTILETYYPGTTIGRIAG
ncbi:MAG TPA: SpoIID/LytB domain-containing protein [Gemmatimonadaceae bacterium]